MNSKTIDLTVPDIGDADSIELVKWYKKQGESFKKGDEICDLVERQSGFFSGSPSGRPVGGDFDL